MSTHEYENTNTHTSSEKTPPKKKISKKPNFFIILCLIAAITGCIMFSFLFNITEIIVEGNETIDANIIIIQSKLTPGENILKQDTKRAKTNIMKNPMIDTVNIVREFPGTIRISVTECKKIAYVKFASNALSIDKNGKILEVMPLSSALDFPVISGVTPSDTTPGEIISSHGNQEGIDTVTELISLLSNTELTSEISSINIDKFNNVSLILKNDMNVIFGKGNLEYKVAYLEVAYPSNLSHKSGGKFDLSDPNKVVLTG